MLNKLIDHCPNHFEALKLRANVFHCLGKNLEVLSNLKKAMQLKPNDSEIQLSYGRTLIEFGRFEAASVYFENAWALTLSSVALQEIGNADLLKGHYALALGALNKAIDMDDNNNSPFAFWKRGVVYSKMQRFQESQNDLKKSLQLDPKNLKVVADLADTFREMRCYDDALKQISTVTTVDCSIEIVRANIFLDKGDLNQAEEILKRIESNNKDFQETQRFLLVSSLLEDKLVLEESIGMARLRRSSKQRDPSRTMETISKSLETMNAALIECSKSYNSESGAAVVLQLKNNVLELKQENSELKNKQKESEKKLKQVESEINQQEKQLEEKERQLQCMICMDNPRDTAIMPCTHLLFCNKCIKKHQRTNKKCPSCRQPIAAVLSFLLEGENSVEEKRNENGKRIEIKQERSMEEEIQTKRQRRL